MYTDPNNVERISYFDEDGEGKLRVYHILEGVKTYLRIKVVPRDKDIDSIRNAILLIDTNDINITMKASSSRN